jgi:hypothetical protein
MCSFQSRIVRPSIKEGTQDGEFKCVLDGARFDAIACWVIPVPVCEGDPRNDISDDVLGVTSPNEMF